MRHLSIGWRLTLWYGITITVLLCSLCVALLLIMRHQVVVRTDAGLIEEIKEIGQEIKLAADTTAFHDAAESRFTQHAFYEFLVTSESGEIIFSSSNLHEADEVIRAMSSSSSSITFQSRYLANTDYYRIVQTDMPSRFGTVRVYVLRSLSPLLTDVSSLQWLMASLLPIGVLIAIGIGHFLARQALAPVQKVLDVANSIDITCLDRRIQVANPHDEIGQLAAALNSLIARLEQAVTEIRRFTADASHELRTPLAALRAEAEAALRAPRTTTEYVSALKVIADEAGRLGRLADQLLQLSRHDAGVIHCRFDSVQLDALLLDVVDQLQAKAASQGVTLECHCQNSCEVLGDDIRLSQVFFNIIENAIKYTSSGGNIEIDLKSEEDKAVIEISDNGIGIPADDLPHIFDRFFRVIASRETETGGAGLGLSIAKAAVVAHQGTIEATSRFGEGTIVTIRLPVSSSSSPAVVSSIS